MNISQIGPKQILKSKSKTVKKISVALRTFVLTVSGASVIQDNPTFSLWVLFIGAALDFILDMLPNEDDTDTPAPAPPDETDHQ